MDIPAQLTTDSLRFAGSRRSPTEAFSNNRWSEETRQVESIRFPQESLDLAASSHQGAARTRDTPCPGCVISIFPSSSRLPYRVWVYGSTQHCVARGSRTLPTGTFH